MIYGPGSVIYGSDALGGVMDFHSKEVRLSNNSKIHVGGDVLLRANTANSERTGHISLNIAGKKFGSFTSVSFNNFGDLIQGSNGNDYLKRPYYVTPGEEGQDVVKLNDNENELVNSGYKQRNFLQKFKYEVNDKLELGYEFLYTTSSDVPRYDRLIQLKKDDDPTSLKYAEWYYGPQEWMMHALKMKLKSDNPLFDEMKATVAYQNVEESRHKRKFGKTSINHRTENVDVYSANLDFFKKIRPNMQLFYGLESVYNYVDSEGYDEDIITKEQTQCDTRYPDGGSDYYSAAAYAGLKYNFAKSFTANAGVRYTYSKLKSSISDTSLFELPFSKVPGLQHMDVSNGSFNGSLGLNFHPNPGFNMSLNLGSGFRAPNLDDLSKIFDSGDGIVVVPNPDLKPEYAYNVDFGVLKTFNKKFRVNANVFYTYLVDAMVRRPFVLGGKDSIMYDGDKSQVQAVQNAGHANIYGVSAGLSWDVARFLNVYSTFTYTKGEDDEKKALRHVPPYFGITGVNFTFSRFRLNMNAEYNGEISNENLSPSEAGKAYLYAKDANGNPYSPAWFTLNSSISYQLKNNLKFVFGVDNILDQRYKPYSSGISAPGRNFMISIRGTI